ncbi:MAG: DNA polymerase III subunit delta' [Comamonadaceae bacterium CG1_02_60_18]|nr:MAG: DNA polymerase III subunit delta' [Comamonadaceae bacterium CG1_02_60_18]PIQ53902.1 MAG: DNA polymerase III subunit delta' [Comamonadaceae bacterium CG12_big_fil_rev_8_21_14_0_65_59_15]
MTESAVNHAAAQGVACSPWIQQQLQALLMQRGHAWLLAGPSGLGQYELALALVSAWLCERPTAQGACGHCASCHAIDVRTHADLCVLMPEAVMQTLGWPLSEKAQSEIDSKKRKMSQEIRVDAMRDAVEFAQRTSARGRGKAVLVFPAERMNVYTANALLKTLEEPPGDVKFVLASDAEHQLLPTILSRCQRHTLVWPEPGAALQWLQQQGVPADQAQVLLRAAGGRPADALQMSPIANVWRSIPLAAQRGDVGVFKDWGTAETVDALQKLCHDQMALKAEAEPRFFDTVDLVAGGSWNSLTHWARSLRDIRRNVEHPFNAGLLQEALVSQAQTALNSAP